MIWKVDIERSYLACQLIDENDFYWITEDYFFNPSNKKLFQAILKIREEWWWADLVSVKTKLQELWNLEYVGWNIFLIDIMNSEYTSANIEYYASQLKEESKRVQLINIADDIKFFATNTNKINWEVFNFSKRLMDINSLGDSQFNMDDAIVETLEYLEERKGKELFGFSWWLDFLDKYTKWLQKWRTYRIWMPSNVWKTQLMYWVINSLVQQKAKVCFITLENDRSFTLSNILANHQEVNSHRIEDWTVTPDVDYLYHNKEYLTIIDNIYDLSEIFTQVLQIQPDVVILDYIWLVNIKKTKEDDKYTEYSKQVQEFVKRARISWIDLSNLPKNQEDEESVRQFWWFYWSSFLKNNTDVWIHWVYYKPFYEWRKSVWETDDNRNYQVINLSITKNRIWVAKVDCIMKINFAKGAKFVEASQEEIERWKNWL